ncbi:MAG: RNA 2'-phosphotransferase [Anaerolineae bacterium]|nr:RNA 2'-phosphotransferase [Anaerolineae bacterium]
MQENHALTTRQRKLSKFLSLLLRHRPARFPIQLDAEGYASLAEIIHILHGLPNFRWASRADVEAVVEAPGRRRFEIAGGQIRALYGHTAFRPDYTPVTPPALLYHGTAPEHLDAIRREGLRPMERRYVHLAATPATAHSIAIRHTTTPVILTIDAEQAHANGIAFYHPTDEIYLCAQLPPDYLEIPQ